MKYDIFISYRRDTGQQYARILQMALEKMGYRVFLDYDEIKDGVFGDNIRQALIDAPIFMPVLSSQYLVRCKNEGDWVREEILLAIEHRKHFIPVNPDGQHDGIPEDIPEDIIRVIRETPHSQIPLGKMLNTALKQMVDTRFRRCVKTDGLKFDVFISYSRKDDKKVKEIKNFIEQSGYYVWIDETGIESSDSFKATIVSAIEDSRIVLFFSSKASNASEWTAKEIGIANKRKKPIVPIKLDESDYNKDVEFDLINLDYIDYTSQLKYNSALKKLTRTLSNKLNGKGTFVYEQPIVPNPSFFKRNKRRCTKALGVMLCALALFITIWLILNRSEGGRSTYIDNTTPSITTNDLMPVDLGLTSGTLWGDRNVGAVLPTDFGNLYAWGEVETKKDYSESTYVELLKPSRSITDSKHDVATKELGEEWSMPTEQQFLELLSECEWYWKKIDGHNGYDVVSKKNGNHIFLPASGWNHGTSVEYQNQYGYYWTSERSSNHAFARSLQFPQKGSGIVGNGYLHYGRSVRGVYKNSAVAE